MAPRSALGALAVLCLSAAPVTGSTVAGARRLLPVASRRASSPPTMSANPLAVMMSGLPGAMGLEIAAASLRREGVELAPFGMTGASPRTTIRVDDGLGGEPVDVELYGIDDRQALAERIATEYPEAGSLVCIDFTHPSAVNSNAEWYAANRLPFVMGTTGGDRAELMRSAQASGIYAVRPCTRIQTQPRPEPDP